MAIKTPEIAEAESEKIQAESRCNDALSLDGCGRRRCLGQRVDRF
jgi:hypothetical protein